MPLKDDSKILGYNPKSSKGIGKSENMKTTKGGKLDKDATLRSSSKSNPIPVVVEENAPIASFVVEEQYSKGKQVYAIQAKVNDDDLVTKVLLARYDNTGGLAIIDWCDAQYVICGVLADQKVDVNQNNPVQAEPETTPIADVTEDKPIRSFVFFDPYMNGEKYVESLLKGALGIQRGIAHFLGLYNGEVLDSKKEAEMQGKINKQIFMVPFNDIPDEFINTYPEFSTFQKSGINGKDKGGYRERYRDYWNNNVAIYNVPVLAIFAHANENLICLYGGGNGFEKDKFKALGFVFPKMDYAVFLGCNIGNTSYDNFATTFANHTVDGIPAAQKQSFWEGLKNDKVYKIYPTAVIAADGNTSGGFSDTDGFITGFVTRTSKYAADDNHTYTKFIKGLGYCVFSNQLKDPVQIPNTCSSAPKNYKEGRDKWIESTVEVKYLLDEAKRIILEKFEGD